MTSQPTHEIIETPELKAALDPLRQRLGGEMPSIAELVQRGARSVMREVAERDRRSRALNTFVDRMCEGPEPDLEEVRRIRHSSRVA